MNAPYLIPSITLENENGLTINSDLYYYFDGKNNGFDFLEMNAEEIKKEIKRQSKPKVILLKEEK